MDLKNFENTVERLAGEHRFIADYLERYSKAYKKRDKAFFADLSSFMASMENGIHSHFVLEEHTFFPAAIHGLKNHNMTLMVLNLVKEHGLLEARLSYIMNNKYAISSGKLENPVMRSIDSFVKDVGLHAEVEIQDFFTALNGSPRCRSFLEHYLDAFTEGYDPVPDIPEKLGTAHGINRAPKDLSGNSGVSNEVARLAGEHKLIATHVTRFERALREKDKSFFADLLSFLELLKKDLRNHFILEELSFFPAALNGSLEYDLTMTVLNLQKEHGTLEIELDSIMQNKHVISAGWIKNPIIERIADFLRALKSHAILELNQVFPKINKDERCHNLLFKYLADMKSST